MANGAGKKQSRDERERARAYRARQEFHESLTARRRRDNLVAGGAGGAGAGIVLGRRLVTRKALMERAFAVLLIAVGIYVAVGAA